MLLSDVIAGLRAAGEPTRFRLLAVLSRAELTVTELTQVLGQSQPRISRHLKLMVEAGLLERFREGTWVFYRVAIGAGRETLSGAGEICELLLQMVPFGDSEIARDMERLDVVRKARQEAAAEYFRQNASEWEETRALHIAERDVETTMLAMVEQFPISELVDIGTGTGRILELFGPRIQKGVGVDLSHEMLAIARNTIEEAELPHCQIRQADLFSLPFENGDLENGGVDLVTIHQVLHYLTDPGAAIQEAARILVPGGRILIVDFAPHDIEALRETHAHRRLGFADEEVRAWCREAGLEVLEIQNLPPKDSGDGKLTVSIWLAKAKGTHRPPLRLEVAQ